MGASRRSTAALGNQVVRGCDRLRVLQVIIERLAFSRLGVLGRLGGAIQLNLDRRLGGTAEEGGGQESFATGQVRAGDLQRVDLLRGVSDLVVVLPLLGVRSPFAPARGVHAGEELVILVLVAHRVVLAASVGAELESEDSGLGRVLHVGVGDAVVVELARVPIARDRAGHDLVVGQLADRALGVFCPLCALITGNEVLEGVGVTTDGHRVRVVGEDLVELVGVVGDDVNVVDDRGVGGDDDLLVIVDRGQVVTQPFQLLLVDLLQVAAVAGAVVAVVDDVVQGDEVGLTDVVGVVRGTEVTAVGVGGVHVVGGVEVEVVITRQGADRAVGIGVELFEIRVQREVVSDVIAEQQDPAAGVVGALCQIRRGSLARVTDLLFVVGLGVGGHRAGLLGGSSGVGRSQREVHRGGDVPGGVQSAERQIG